MGRIRGDWRLCKFLKPPKEIETMTTKQENHEEQSPRTFVTAPADWPIGMTLPDAPNVQLYFWGIMGFRPDLVKHECEIGVHFGNPTHSLKVVVLENFQDV